MFHKFKKDLVFEVLKKRHKDLTVDKEYEDAHGNLLKMIEMCDEISKYISAHIEHQKGVAASAAAMTCGLDELLQTDAGHAFSPVAAKSKDIHTNFLQDTLEVAVVKMESTSLDTLNKLVEKNTELQTRHSERNQLRSELGYYTQKVADLMVEKEKVKSKGKAPRPKDEERLSRNEQNVADITEKYTTFNQNLTVELQQYWEQRFSLLGPILTEFITAEQCFGQLFSSAVQDVGAELGKAPKGGSSWESLMSQSPASA